MSSCHSRVQRRTLRPDWKPQIGHQAQARAGMSTSPSLLRSPAKPGKGREGGGEQADTIPKANRPEFKPEQ